MFNNKIKISNKIIEETRCFIVAEISANHNKNFKILKILLELKYSGVDAVSSSISSQYYNY